jgi:tRNA threonylcarbamoyladenosine biosynthesis protein TsaB
MMRILGIDSSVPQGSVALLENDQIISETFLGQGSGNHSDALLRMVDDVLCESQYKIEDLDGFSVTTGPGSFTGLRVGVSLVKGFALAKEKPIQGIDTLEAVSACTEPIGHPICAILDARKKEVYCAFFRYEGNKLKRSTPDKVISPEELCELVSEPTVFIGSGLATYGEFFSGRLGSLFIDNSKAIKHSVAASAALLARPHLENNPCFDLGELKIKYVRKSDAELNLMKQTL